MAAKNTRDMKRGDAAKLIEAIRVALADDNGGKEGQGGKSAAETVARIKREFEERGIPELVPCTGDAHTNPHIDNCGGCAPRWGFTGPTVVVK